MDNGDDHLPYSFTRPMRFHRVAECVVDCPPDTLLLTYLCASACSGLANKNSVQLSLRWRHSYIVPKPVLDPDTKVNLSLRPVSGGCAFPLSLDATKPHRLAALVHRSRSKLGCNRGWVSLPDLYPARYMPIVAIPFAGVYSHPTQPPKLHIYESFSALEEAEDVAFYAAKISRFIESPSSGDRLQAGQVCPRLTRHRQGKHASGLLEQHARPS